MFSLTLNKSGHNGNNQAIDVGSQKEKSKGKKNGVPDIEDLRGHHNSPNYEKDEIRREHKL